MHKKLFASLLLITTAFLSAQDIEFEALNSDAGIIFININDVYLGRNIQEMILATRVVPSVGILESRLKGIDKSPLIKKEEGAQLIDRMPAKDTNFSSKKRCTCLKDFGYSVQSGVKLIHKNKVARYIIISLMMYKFLL